MGILVLKALHKLTKIGCFLWPSAKSTTRPKMPIPSVYLGENGGKLVENNGGTCGKPVESLGKRRTIVKNCKFPVGTWLI